MNKKECIYLSDTKASKDVVKRICSRARRLGISKASYGLKLLKLALDHGLDKKVERF